MSTPGPEEVLATVVRRKEEVADGVVALTLVADDGGDLPPWEPGAHVDLLLRPGLVRQYSLCGDPGDRGAWRLAVLREQGGRGGSRHVHDVLREGDPLQVRGPRNTFPLRPSGAGYVLVAGGVGITPILPMLPRVAVSGAPWRLVYGGRRRATMAFLDELAAFGPRVQVRPQDESGLLDLEEAVPADLHPDAEVYCCGPEPLLVAVEKRCAELGRTAPRVERFAPRAVDGRVDVPFEVELASTGRVITVPAGRSILDTLEEHGELVLSSCREGTCGTCETTVLAGTVEHRDSILSPEERAAADVIHLCVSRARGGRLVLDL